MKERMGEYGYTEESLYLGSCEAACALRSVIYVEKIGRVHMEC